MIMVDYRAGSEELAKPLEKMGLPVQRDQNGKLPTLPFGDIAFAGRGIGGALVDVGIEYKKLGEFITCCRDGRFAGQQLPGLTGPKKIFDYAWLLLESPSGGWRADEKGFVCTYKGPRIGWKQVPGHMRASEMEKHLLTFAVCGGIQVQQTETQAGTLRFISNIYHWWTDVDLDKHTSHLAVHTPSMMGDVSPFRKAVMGWPGIGLKTSRAVEQRFGSIKNAAMLNEAEWAELETDGRRFGRPAAEKLVKFLRGVK